MEWLPHYIRSSLRAVSGFLCGFAMVLCDSGERDFDLEFHIGIDLQFSSLVSYVERAFISIDFT